MLRRRKAGSLRRVGFGQPNTAVGIGKVLGEVLAIQGLNSRPALTAPTESGEKIETDRVQLSQIDDCFG